MIENLIKQIEQMRVKIEDSQEILKRITSIEGSCPVCERKLNSKIKEKIMKQKKSEIKNFKKKIKELNEKKEITDSEFSNLNQNLSLDLPFISMTSAFTLPPSTVTTT